MHERLDALEHGVEVVGEPVELVAGAGDRQPPGEVAVHDLARGLGHRVDAPEHPAGDEQTARHPEHDHDRERPAAGREHDLAQALALLEVAADQQAKTRRELEHAHQRVVLCAVVIVEAAIGGLGPAWGLEDAGRERADIAREPLPGRGRHQIKARTGTPGARVDDEDEAADAALAVLLGEPGDLGIDRLGDLLGDQPAGVPGEIAQQEGREQHENSEIDERQLERRRAQDLAERRHPPPVAVIPPPVPSAHARQGQVRRKG